jgi:hypothetical protein
MNTYILLDALDEMLQRSAIAERKELLAIINGIVNEHTSNLHVLATSRNEPDIRDSLKHIASRSICLGEYAVNADIAHYVHSRLQDPGENWKDYSEELRDSIKKSETLRIPSEQIETALIAARSSSQIEMAQLMVPFRADRFSFDTKYTTHQITLLITERTMAKVLIKAGTCPYLASWLYLKSPTPLISAALYGDLNASQRMLDVEASFSGYTDAESASETDHLEIYFNQTNALLVALAAAHNEVVQLIRNAWANARPPTPPDSHLAAAHDLSLLSLAYRAAVARDSELLPLFLDAGLDACCRFCGKHPFWIEVHNGEFRTVESLCRYDSELAERFRAATVTHILSATEEVITRNV